MTALTAVLDYFLAERYQQIDNFAKLKMHKVSLVGYSVMTYPWVKFLNLPIGAYSLMIV